MGRKGLPEQIQLYPVHKGLLVQIQQSPARKDLPEQIQLYPAHKGRKVCRVLGLHLHIIKYLIYTALIMGW